MGLIGKNNEEKIWNYLINFGFNEYATAGIMGNLYAESGLNSKNLQNSFEKKFNMSDEEYTAMVDSGIYKNFANDSAGYGLAQWTYKTRKLNLLNFIKSKGKSIGDLESQLDFLVKEISENYKKSVYSVLQSASSVKEASDVIILKFERPADQSDTAKNKRASYGLKYYNKYANKEENNMADYSKYINSTRTHYISNSGSDENKKYHGGVAGDQTGHEWELRSWYSRPWTHVFRYEKNPKVGETICNLACAAALNDKIGYDQYQRTTYWAQLQKVQYDPSKITIACEEDCSAGTAANVKAAGYLLGISALQNVSANMTSRNTVSELKKAGFTVLTESKYLTSGKYLLPGDILLYENHHVAENVTRGKYASTTPTVPSPDLTGNGIGYATALGTMNVREEPNTNSKNYGTIPKGTKLEVLEIANGWYKVVFAKSPTGYGYTSNTTGKYYTFVENKTSSNVIQARNKPTDKKETYAGTYITTASTLNIRHGAGTSNGIIVTVPKGTVVNCDGSYSTYNNTVWLYVTFTYKSMTISGFASIKYLSGKDIIYTVTGSSVNVRKGVGTSYASIGIIHKGDKVTYKGITKNLNGQDWIYGTCNKLEGYISTKYLKKE